jgi:hypothetical protein
MLSALGPAVIANPSRPATVETRAQHRQELKAERHQKLEAARQKRQAEYNSQYVSALNAAPSVGQGVDFALHTLTTAHKLIHSPNLRNVAWNFTKLSFSHDSRKVAAAYLDAFVKGHWNRFGPLANTRAVTSIGKEYTALSHSPDVKKISRAFSHFGDAIKTQVDHLFTLGSGV